MRQRKRKSRKKKEEYRPKPENSGRKRHNMDEKIKKQADEAIAKIDAVLREVLAKINREEKPTIPLCDGTRVDIRKFFLR